MPLISKTPSDLPQFKVTRPCDSSYSDPYSQFNDQMTTEIARIMDEDYMQQKHHPPKYMEIRETAKQNMRRKWMAQGIWRDEWDTPKGSMMPMMSMWKHQEPTEQSQMKEWDASRPMHQFIAQMMEECERMQKQMSTPLPQDMCSMAYEQVRKNWMERGIWMMEWTMMPGMTWGHEMNSGDMQMQVMQMRDTQTGNMHMGNMHMGNMHMGNMQMGNMKMGDKKMGNMKMRNMQTPMDMKDNMNGMSRQNMSMDKEIQQTSGMEQNMQTETPMSGLSTTMTEISPDMDSGSAKDQSKPSRYRDRQHGKRSVSPMKTESPSRFQRLIDRIS